MTMAEEAYVFDYAYHFVGLDDILEEHKPVACSHHMISCRRQEDWLFELAVLMKAIESSTKKNTTCVEYNLY